MNVHAAVAPLKIVKSHAARLVRGKYCKNRPRLTRVATCNHSVGAALNARCATNGMYAQHPFVTGDSKQKESRRVISAVACCPNVNLCALAVRVIRSQQYLEQGFFYTLEKCS